MEACFPPRPERRGLQRAIMMSEINHRQRAYRPSLPVRLCLLEALLDATLNEFEAEDRAVLTALSMTRINGHIRVRVEAQEAQADD